MRRRLILGAAATVVTAAAAATATVATKPALRTRVQRSSRLWLLGARRSAAYVPHVVRRRAAADAAAREELDRQFTIRTAADVARELGHMKGAVMKAGQLVSFIVEALPDEAQAALATLQSEAPPMAPSLAEQVVTDELGRHPSKLFARWEPVPVAAASIGQVHRATLKDGREVAVKVQYPGVGDAIGADLANAEVLYAMFSALALKSLDVKGMVDELRARMVDELDYRKELANQLEFGRLYANHPFIRIPEAIPEYCTERVLVSEWVDGQSWATFEATAPRATKEAAAEVLFRFAQQSVYRHRVFNGDPHPGNYRFHPDGTITFLDFGLVKRWTAAEIDALWPVIEPLLGADALGTVAEMVTAGFLQADHGLAPADVYAYVSAPYVPFLTDTFTFTRTFVADTLGTIIDVRGPYQPVIEKLNLPTSFVILDRVVWGMSALLGKLEATNRWRAILDEYRLDGPPATPLGEAEARWRENRRP